MLLQNTYDPFGNVKSNNAPMTFDIDDLNRYTYNGEDYDFNTGLQYLRARYYNTSTGSFISQDTYLGSALSALTLNRYTYTANSPVMFDDPTGHWPSIKGMFEAAETALTNAKETVVNAYNDAKNTVNAAVNVAKTYVENKVEDAKEAIQKINCTIT